MFPDIPVSLERNTEFPAPINLSPFSPPDLDMRIDSHASSGRGLDLHVPPQEAGLTLKLERKPRVSCHILKDTDFPVHSRKVPMPGHLFECNPEDEVTTRRDTDNPVASYGNIRRFQKQLDKWPVTP